MITTVIPGSSETYNVNPRLAASQGFNPIYVDRQRAQAPAGEWYILPLDDSDNSTVTGILYFSTSDPAAIRVADPSGAVPDGHARALFTQPGADYMSSEYATERLEQAPLVFRMDRATGLIKSADHAADLVTWWYCASHPVQGYDRIHATPATWLTVYDTILFAVPGSAQDYIGPPNCVGVELKLNNVPGATSQ